MNTKNLAKACELFAKLAQQLNKQQKKVDPEKKKAIDLWANTLVSGYQGAITFLPSLAAAKKVFEAIALYRKASAYNDGEGLKIIESLLTAITFSIDKLHSLGVNPVDVLKQKGVENANDQTLPTMIANLTVLRDAVNFEQYKDFYFAPPRKPGQMIELDIADIEFEASPPVDVGTGY